MDWTLYPTLYNYCSQLPNDSQGINIQRFESEQCIEYPIKKNPVTKTERIVLPIKRTTNIPSNNSNNESLWNLIASIIDENTRIYTNIFKKENTQYLIRSLKDFIIKPEIKSIITGQRMYMILEMLDKSYTELTLKHIKALGFFISFLFNSQVQIDENLYKYNDIVNTEKTISISRNSNGLWYIINNKIDKED
jgi:hypothetical protein